MRRYGFTGSSPGMIIINFVQVLTLSQVTIGRISIGHIVNLASNDVQRFDMVLHNTIIDHTAAAHAQSKAQ